MRVAALYDVHANLPALRAVLRDVADAHVDLLVFGGDLVAGPLPRETLVEIESLETPARFVRGNADREVVETGRASFAPPAEPSDLAVQMATFTASRLSSQQLGFLDSFSATVTVEVDGLGSVVFCHGSPRSDTEPITTATPDERLRGILAQVAPGVIVCGHTHRQFDRRLDGWRVINAGSVGMPYEGRTGAFWALLGPEVELRRTEYDVSCALAQLRAGGFKALDDMLHESLIEPMDPDEVAAHLEP